jgi:hypothetical protein
MHLWTEQGNWNMHHRRYLSELLFADFFFYKNFLFVHFFSPRNFNIESLVSFCP